MRFIKGFGKSDPRETARKKLLELEIGEKAIYLPESIGKDEDFHLVREVAEELIAEKQLDGILVGQKGWLLPQGDKKLETTWNLLQKGKVDLKEVADRWGLNEKRVIIALEDFSTSKALTEPVFHRDGMDLYLVSYFRQAWTDLLAKIDEEEPSNFDSLISSARIPDKGLLKEFAQQWIAEESSVYALGKDGLIRPKSTIPELVVTYIEEAWEANKLQLTYWEIADIYGLTTIEVERILQKLIDSKELTGVTLWATDEIIKPQL
ncbi:MAG: hypothetical protein ACXAE3_12375 [Candidatus Kariarchaeaceae archaeon]|jgi:hypothetical protein